jgi:LmbE family N-acetylglucosaminyl deacetylase
MCEQTKPLSILAVVAHPHDITHMSGTLAHQVAAGDSVTAVSVTGGLKTHREKLHDELRKAPADRDPAIMAQSDDAYADQKASEMGQVCALFGVNDVRILPFGDYPITGLEITEEMVETLAEVIWDVRPDLVLTHAPYAPERHGFITRIEDDHPTIGIAVQHALRRALQPPKDSGRVAHKVAAVYYTGVDLPTHESDLYIDITDQAENRLKAETLFASQNHTFDFARKRIEIGAGQFGWMSGYGYAEGWIRSGAQRASRLTLTPEELALAKRGGQDTIAAMSTMVKSDNIE